MRDLREIEKEAIETYQSFSVEGRKIDDWEAKAQ